MKSITQNKRYLPHEISTKVQSVKLYRQTKDIGFVCRRYHISKASLMRWNKLYDGTKTLLSLSNNISSSTAYIASVKEQTAGWVSSSSSDGITVDTCADNSAENITLSVASIIAKEQFV